MQYIVRVVLFKRTGYKDCMQQIEIRVGDTPIATNHGLKRIHANYNCGSTSSRTDTAVEAVTCGYARAGRYMSLQSHAAAMINMAEVNVYSGRERGEIGGLLLSNSGVNGMKNSGLPLFQLPRACTSLLSLPSAHPHLLSV